MFSVVTIVKILILFNLLNAVFVYGDSMNLRLRNTGLRIIVFKEKKLGKIFKGIKNLSEIYYNKMIVYTAEGINKYNELSDEDKSIIETIISLYY